jgi:hypothetical protein
MARSDSSELNSNPTIQIRQDTLRCVATEMMYGVRVITADTHAPNGKFAFDFYDFGTAKSDEREMQVTRPTNRNGPGQTVLSDASSKI